jgi:hypothetical protein
MKLLRAFVYMAAAAFYLNRSPQPFGNKKNHFTVYGVHVFFAFKTLERKSYENLLCMHCSGLKTCGQCTSLHCSQVNCTVHVNSAIHLHYFFLNVLIVLMFF